MARQKINLDSNLNENDISETNSEGADLKSVSTETILKNHAETMDKILNPVTNITVRSKGNFRGLYLNMTEEQIANCNSDHLFININDILNGFVRVHINYNENANIYRKEDILSELNTGDETKYVAPEISYREYYLSSARKNNEMNKRNAELMGEDASIFDLTDEELISHGTFLINNTKIFR